MTWRPPLRVDRQIVALWAVCAVGFVALRPVWLSAASFMPPCLWHQWSGFACPGCGTTRAIVHLLRAEPSLSFAMNPLVAAGAAGFVAGGLVAPLWLTLGGGIPDIRPGAHPGWIAAALAAVAANWVWLLVSGV